MLTVPFAADDSFSTLHDQPITGSPGLLENDYDMDGDPLMATLLTNPGNGSLNFNADGTFTYTPDAGYVGNDSFTYNLSDGTETSNTATVSLTITNIAPTTSDDSFSTLHDQVLTELGGAVFSNDSDIDGEPLMGIIVSLPTSGTLRSPNGSALLNVGDMFDGNFNYIPSTGFVGNVTFNYKVTDGVADSNPATVTIGVTNNVPNAVDDTQRYFDSGTYFTDGETLTVSATDGVLADDYDLDGDPLTAVLLTSIPSAYGLFFFDSLGAFAFTPAPGCPDVVQFDYAASDGAAQSPPKTVKLFRVTFDMNFDIVATPIPAGVDKVVFVGEKMLLVPQVVIGGVQQVTTDHQWTIDGVFFKEYHYNDSPGFQQGYVEYLSSSELQNKTVTFHWQDGGDDRNASVTCSVGNNRYTVTRRFDVKRPEVQINAKTIASDDGTWGAQKWTYAGSGDPGIQFRIEDGTGMQIDEMNNPDGGDFIWIQIVTTKLVTATLAGGGSYFSYSYGSLDSESPYDTGFVTDDSPELPYSVAGIGNFARVDVFYEYAMFLLWRPNAAGQYVPLRQLNWTLDVEIEKSANAPAGQNGWHAVPGGSYSWSDYDWDQTGNDVNYFPTWWANAADDDWTFIP